MKLRCAADEITALTPAKVKAILDKDKKGEFLLLDVRQPEEYEDGHIPGAMLIPLGELEARQEELDRNKKIIAYCRSGHRSMAAAIALCGLGFKDVSSLEGGILNWRHEAIPGVPEARPELITKAADVKDVLMLATKLERGSRNFYLAAKKKATPRGARETFQMLASAEDGHMQRLRERAVTMLGEGASPPLEKLKQELKVEHMEGAVRISPALAKVDKGFSNEMEALEMALQKEYMSYDFYKRTSVLVNNQHATVLLHELALQERNHAHILLRLLSETVRATMTKKGYSR